MMNAESALRTSTRADARKKAREKTSVRARHIGREAIPYFMVAPSMAILAAFVLYPIGYMIYLSFYKWNMIGPMKYVGLKNYLNLFHDADFWAVMGNTFQYMVFTVGLSMVLGILLALHFKKNNVISKILQSAGVCAVPAPNVD